MRRRIRCAKEPRFCPRRDRSGGMNSSGERGSFAANVDEGATDEGVDTRETRIRATGAAVDDDASGQICRVQVNGNLHSLNPATSVQALLIELGLGGKRVAVALNRSVIPRSRYGETLLSAGDRVEILEAVGGG
jgi:sulfur carrier protein